MLIRTIGESDWREPEVNSYDSEGALQALLASSPALLPNASDSLAVVREFSVTVGYIDLVGVDANGDLLLCECKLERNAQARRAVVGQLLSYAGALWKLPAEQFLAEFERKLEGSVTDALAECDSWTDEETFHANLRRNLESGRFRLVVAVDRITDDLKETIEYLNSHTSDGVSILALEISHVRDGTTEIVFPNTFGEETARAKTTRRGTWDENAFLAALEATAPSETVEDFLRFWNYAKAEFQTFFGEARYPSAGIIVPIDGVDPVMFTIYTGEQATVISVNFAWLRQKGVSAERMSQIATFLRQRFPGCLSDLEGLEQSEFRRRPGIGIETVFGANSGAASLRDLIDSLRAGE